MADFQGDSSGRSSTRRRSSGSSSRRSSQQSFSRSSRGTSQMPRNRLSLGGSRGRGLGTREIAMLVGLSAIVILLLVLIVNGVRGCVAGRNGANTQEAQVQSAEEEQPAVSKDVSEQLAGALTTALDRNDQIAAIARDAGKYGSEDIVYLALEEPAAIPWVSAYPKATKEAKDFTDEVEKGTIPEFYTFDSRWGNIDFAGDAFAITGSAPTCVSMAYMGLTGSVTRTPNVLADMAAEEGYTETGGVTEDFFITGVNAINGLACTKLEPAIQNLTAILATGNVMVVKLPANSQFGRFARYVLATGISETGAISVHDPLSAQNTAREWSSGTLASEAEVMYSLQATSTPTD